MADIRISSKYCHDTILLAKEKMGFGLELSVSILSIFAFFGLIGNSFVIFLIFRRFKFESWTYLLVCHLAMSDLMTSMIGAPLWIATYTSKEYSVCKAAIFISTVPMIVSSWTLILIAYDRYVYIKYPLQHHLIVTARKIVTYLILLWLFSFGTALISITVGVDNSDEIKTRYCVYSALVNRWVSIWIFAIFALLPILALAFVYSYILRTALKQQRKVEEFSSVEDKRTKTAKAQKERQTILMLCTVVFVYVISVLPYSIVGLLDGIDTGIIRKNRWAYLTSMLLFFNAVLNPLLYTLMNKELRKEAYKVFSCRCNSRIFDSPTSQAKHARERYGNRNMDIESSVL